MLSGDEQRNQRQNHPFLHGLYDDHIEQAIVYLRVRHGLHAAADVASVSDGQNGESHILRGTIIDGNLRLHRAIIPYGGDQTAEIGAQTGIAILIQFGLAQDIHIKARSTHVQKADIVHSAHVDPAWLCIQLHLQCLNRVAGEIQSADEIIARSAGNDDQRRGIIANAVDGLIQRTIAAHDDNAVQLIVYVARGDFIRLRFKGGGFHAI